MGYPILPVAKFSYDAFGRRTSKTDSIGNTTTYLYDGDNPIQETRGGTVTTLLTGLGIDERYARDDAGIGNREYFLTDALGSTLALTDASGAVRQTYAYEPYGEVASSGDSDNPYQYTGRENDGTGLYYYRARYYSPGMKRFISSDPIGLAGGLNTYAYVHQKPINRRDPFGLMDQCTPVGCYGENPWDYLPPPPPAYEGCTWQCQALIVPLTSAIIILQPEIPELGAMCEAAAKPIQKTALNLCLVTGICTGNDPDKFADDMKLLQEIMIGIETNAKAEYEIFTSP